MFLLKLFVHDLNVLLDVLFPASWLPNRDETVRTEVCSGDLLDGIWHGGTEQMGHSVLSAPLEQGFFLLFSHILIFTLHANSNRLQDEPHIWLHVHINHFVSLV